MDIKEKIREFVTSNFLKGQELEIFDDVSFIDEAIIDSVGVLELVAFLEESFDFRVEDEEIIPENLDSINKLAIYVQSKLIITSS